VERYSRRELLITRCILQAVKLSADKAGGQEWTKQPLSLKQARQMIDLDKNPRDMALIGLLLTTGIRRSEAVSLRWVDVNFERGVLVVLHGKGDKAREIPVTDASLEKLRAWQMVQPSGYVHVFTSLKRNGEAGSDTPLSGTDADYRGDPANRHTNSADDCRTCASGDDAGLCAGRRGR